VIAESAGSDASIPVAAKITRPKVIKRGNGKCTKFSKMEHQKAMQDISPSPNNQRLVDQLTAMVKFALDMGYSEALVRADSTCDLLLNCLSPLPIYQYQFAS
jgi:hypothetical protein